MISLLASHRREKGKVKKSHSSGKGVDETYKSTWFAYEALAFLGDRNNPRKRLNTEITNEQEQIASTSTENHNSSECISPTGPAPKKKKSDENKKMVMLSEALGVLKSAASTTTPELQNNNPNNFETLSFSNFICSKMQQYNRSTKIAVQRAITDIIFKADEGCTNCSQHYNSSAFNSQFNYSGYTTGSIPSSNEPPSLPNRSEPYTSGYTTGQNQTSYVTAPHTSPVPSESSRSSYEDVDFVDDLI